MTTEKKTDANSELSREVRERGPTFHNVRDAYHRRVFTPREVSFPGEGTRLRVRVLSERELDTCRSSAIQRVKEQRVDTVVDRDVTLEREQKRQVIWHSFLTERDSEKGERVRFFPTDTELRDELDAATLDALYELYLEHEAMIADGAVLSDEVADNAIDAALADSSGASDGVLVGRIDARDLRVLAARLFARLRASASKG